MPDTAAAVLIVFAAALIRGLFGFGDSMLAVPLLALRFGLETATPLMGLVANTMAVIIAAWDWRAIERGAVVRLALASAVGVPLGMWLLRRVDATWLLAGLGLLICAVSGSHLLGARARARIAPWLAYPFGFVAGVLGGAYNTNGPPVVLYASLSHWPPAVFRATLQGYFVLAGIAIVGGHAAGGLWTRSVLTLYAVCLPVALLALGLGTWLHRRIHPERFDRYVHGLLVVLGSFLVVRLF